MTDKKTPVTGLRNIDGEREVPEHSHCELCGGVKGQCNCPTILPTDKIIEIDGKRILTR